MNKGDRQAEALSRARNGEAWQALGRQVRKGEHGVKILTYVPMTEKTEDEDVEPKTYRRPKTTTVFHISQTDAIE